MPRAGLRGRQLGAALRRDGAGGLVERVHLDQVGAQVGDQHEVVVEGEDRVMRVGSRRVPGNQRADGAVAGHGVDVGLAREVVGHGEELALAVEGQGLRPGVAGRGPAVDTAGAAVDPAGGRVGHRDRRPHRGQRARGGVAAEGCQLRVEAVGVRHVEAILGVVPFGVRQCPTDQEARHGRERRGRGVERIDLDGAARVSASDVDVHRRGRCSVDGNGVEAGVGSGRTVDVGVERSAARAAGQGDIAAAVPRAARAASAPAAAHATAGPAGGHVTARVRERCRAARATASAAHATASAAHATAAAAHATASAAHATASAASRPAAGARGAAGRPATGARGAPGRPAAGSHGLATGTPASILFVGATGEHEEQNGQHPY